MVIMPLTGSDVCRHFLWAVLVLFLALAVSLPVMADGNAVTVAPAISTAVGHTWGPAGYSGDGGVATGAVMYAPNAVAFDSQGNLYIADQLNSVIRVVNLQASAITVAGVTIQPGKIATVAGMAQSHGYNGDGPALSVQLNYPGGVAPDRAGNLYIADSRNYLVRKVDAAGNLTTVAGGGTYIGANPQSGTSVRLGNCGITSDGPNSIAVDAAGNVYIPDCVIILGNSQSVVRALNTQAQPATILGAAVPPGCVATVADPERPPEDGDPFSLSVGPAGVALDYSGNLYFTQGALVYRFDAVTGARSIVAGSYIVAGGVLQMNYGYSGDGGPATIAQLNAPRGITVDAGGNLYIADTWNDVVRKVDARTGLISTVAGNHALYLSEGRIYIGDGGPAVSAGLGLPTAVAVDAAGNLYISDQDNNVIRKVTSAAGPVSFPATKVGASAPAQSLFLLVNHNTTMQLQVPASQGGAQEFLPQMSGGQNCSLDGATTIVAGTVCPVSIVFQPAFPGVRQQPLVVKTNAGTLRFGLGGIGQGPAVAFVPGVISTVAATGGGTTLVSPLATAVDAAGNLFIADSGNHVIRKVDAVSHTLSIVAGTNQAAGYGGNGGPATSALLNFPTAVAVDATGSLLIADTYNHVIRKVDTATQTITTVAGHYTTDSSGYPLGGYGGDGGLATSAQLNGPIGIALDVYGNLYIGDTGNNLVRRVDASAQAITTVAGQYACCNSGSQPLGGYSGDTGPGTSAQLNGPIRLAVDASGNLYIADQQNNVIRRLDGVTKTISTVAGTSDAGYSGDGGIATSAQLSGPSDVALDAAGNLYIADSGNNVLRKVDAASQNINTVAGSGTVGYGGDGGPATSATFNPLQGLSVSLDAVGNLYMADSNNEVVRTVSAGAAPLDFSSQNAALKDQLVTLSNIGNTTLAFSGNAVLQTGTDFGTDGSGCTAFWPGSAGSSCATYVHFQPTTAGPFTDNLVFTDNALNAAGATQSVALLGKAPQQQTISFYLNPFMTPHTYGAQFWPYANATSGLPVSFSVLSGPAALEVSSNPTKATFTGVGTVTIEATQAGNSIWLPAAAVDASIDVSPASLAIKANDRVKAYGQTATFAGTEFTASGLVQSDSVTSVTLSSAGAASTAAVGTYDVVASGAVGTGLGNYTISYYNGTLTVSGGSATTLGADVNPQLLGSSVTFTAHVTPLGASGTPTGTVTFNDAAMPLGSTSLNGSGTATYVTSSLAMGTHSITATYSGDSAFSSSASAVVPEVIQGIQASLSVTGVPTSPQAYGAAFTVGSSGGSGTGAVMFSGSGACAASGTTITMTSGTGICSVTATKAADANYAATTSAAATVNAVLVGQSLSFTAGTMPVSAVYGSTFAPAAEASSGLAVTLSVSGGCSIGAGVVTMTSGAIACVVRADQAGNANYSAATQIAQTVAATLATQAALTVTGMPPAAQAYGATFTVGSSGGSGTGAVTFAGSGACSVSASAITMTSGTGVCSVTATKSADSNYRVVASATATVDAVPSPVSSTTPVIEGLSPNSVKVGAAGFTLTVTGANLSGGTVYWKPLNGSASACATTAVDAGTLTVMIPGTPACADLSSAGAVNITVKSAGGIESTAFVFSIDGMVGSTTSGTATSTVTAQAQDVTLNVPAGQATASSTTVSFQGATQASIISITANCYNLPSGATCSYNQSAQQLTFNIPAGISPGSYPVLVVFTITQQTQTAALGRHRILLASWMGFLGLPLGAVWIGGMRRKMLAWLTVGLIAVGLLLSQTGCGGGFSSVSGQSTAQASTTVTLNVHR